MPITPQSILPARKPPEVATGPIVGIGTGFVRVRVRQDMTVTALVGAGNYVVGQVVSVAIPGGNLSAAQVIGSAGGTTSTVRQICVRIGE